MRTWCPAEGPTGRASDIGKRMRRTGLCLDVLGPNSREKTNTVKSGMFTRTTLSSGFHRARATSAPAHTASMPAAKLIPTFSNAAAGSPDRKCS